MIETDVLVIGAGLAGLRAAIAARAAGARVLVAVKGKFGRSGSSAMTTAGYAAVLPDAGDDDVGRHVADTLSGGADVCDPLLARLVCAGAAAEVAFLEGIGAAFQREGGRHRRSPSGDHSRERVLLVPNNLGTDLTVPLAVHARSRGVEALEYHMALDLPAADGRVHGAVLFDTRGRRLVPVAAKAVILATGGAGRLYAVTSNPNDVTGDGFALAAEAGAELRDMEFVQFYPWRCIDPFDKARVSIQPSTFVLGARLYNAAGERFMARFNPNGAEITTRDVGARGIFEEIRHGRGIGGGVRLDLSPLSQAEFERSNPKVARYLEGSGIDWRTYPFVVTPEAHFWMGGVTIDPDGRATVAGLYAAGETAGGIHGANRLNSNALPDTLVIGRRAGEAATREAVAGSAAVVGDTHAARQAALARGGAFDEAALARELEALRAAMWRCLGIVRDAELLGEGLAIARALAGRLAADGPADAGAVRAHRELAHLASTAELAITSALTRRESRGAHFREDFPERDPVHFHGSTTVRRMAGGAVTAGFRPARSLPHAA